MVALSRLSSLALLAASSSGARIKRRAQDCFSVYDGQALLSLKACASPSDVLSRLEETGCKVVTGETQLLQTGCEGAEVTCSHQIAAMLGDIAVVEQEDAGAYWRESSGSAKPFAQGEVGIQSDFYAAWRDLDARMAKVESLVAASGGLATIETIGQSLQGRDMKIVRMRGPGYSRGGTRVVLTFNLHAREWITGMSGVYTVEKLIEKVRDEPQYLAGTEVVLMPMANPDGFYYTTTTDRMHRKNMFNASARCPGVDLNRNFDAHWGQGGSSSNPCTDTYMGPSAGSEPETRIIGDLLKEAPTDVFIDVHAYSELIITSYGWTTADHPRKGEYRAIGGEIQKAIRRVGGNTWTEGPIAQTLYQATGSSNDFADDLGILGICFELRPGRYGGGGFAPRENQILLGAQECFAGIVASINYAKNPLPPAAPSPPAPPPSCNCPWYCDFTGCGGRDCNCCDKCP